MSENNEQNKATESTTTATSKKITRLNRSSSKMLKLNRLSSSNSHVGKSRILTQPETRSIICLAFTLIVIVGLTTLLAWRWAPAAGPQLLALALVAALLIELVAFDWVYRVNRRLVLINEQLAAARVDRADYEMTLNDEGLFSSLHNELYHYVRQTQALEVDLERDRRQLTVAITDIAHQLRTPIATIDNLLELLTTATLTTNRAELLRQNQSLERLVEQLILLAKVDTHTLSQLREPIVFDTLLHQSLDMLLPQVADKDLRLDWQVEPTLVVNVNAKLIQEALINILKNTFEHAPQQSTVAVVATQTPISTVLTLTNQGEPIAAKDLPHLFERFCRGASSSPNNLGIGLAIAAGIVQASDGRLSIQNEPQSVSYRLELFR